MMTPDKDEKIESFRSPPDVYLFYICSFSMSTSVLFTMVSLILYAPENPVDNIKHNNIHIVGVSEGEESK